jgi:Predicted protease with the C-terminal PDZ domain
MLHALALLLAPAAPVTVPAHPYTIEYTFRSTEPATHLGDVTVRVTRRDADETVFQLPMWYPGRYAIYNFAANAQEVAARCGEEPAAAPKRDLTTWIVRCPARPRAHLQLPGLLERPERLALADRFHAHQSESGQHLRVRRGPQARPGHGALLRPGRLEGDQRQSGTRARLPVSQLTTS